MEWLDAAVLAVRWLLAALLAYGAYLCLLGGRTSSLRPPRKRRTFRSGRPAGASGLLVLIAVVLVYADR